MSFSIYITNFSLLWRVGVKGKKIKEETKKIKDQNNGLDKKNSLLPGVDGP